MLTSVRLVVLACVATVAGCANVRTLLLLATSSPFYGSVTFDAAGHAASVVCQIRG